MAARRHGKGHRSPTRGRRTPGLTGTVRLTHAGGEVDTAEGAFRVSRRGLSGAMEGDKVCVSLHRGRGGHRMATVEQVVEHATAAVVGTFEPAGPLGAVRPLDTRLTSDFFVLPEDDSPVRLGVAPGDIVAARILTYPSRQESGVVTLERRIGDSSAPDLGIQCIMARYGLGGGFSAAALAEAAELDLDMEAALADPLRRDLRDRFAITIDPVDARDFDDAISVERRADGGWDLGVHIADVSHYVAWESSIDLEARRRGTSVYLADRVLPMLPEALSNELCSLKPDEDRLAVTVDMRLDAHGRVTGCEAYPSAIHSKVRLDYGTADELLAALPAADRPGSGLGDKAVAAAAAARACGVDLAAFLREADELARARQLIRRKRGAIDFNTVEVHAILDEDGLPVELVQRRRSAATGLIEEAMLLANECVAEYLADRTVPAAFRVHEPPSPDGLAAAAKVLVELGAASRERAADIVAGEPRAIAATVEESAGTPLEPMVSALLLRAQSRAVYKPQNDGHYALGARAYCHFTSPIRRYPDLLVHRALKVALARERLGAGEGRSRAPRLTGSGSQALARILPQLCRSSSTAERTADAAALASQKVKIAQFFEGRVGERLAGMVSWVSDMGVFVRLDGTGAEGLVRMSCLGEGEWWDFDEMRLRVVGSSTGRVVGLGQRVVVEVESVNVLRGHLDLRLVGAESAVRMEPRAWK